MLGQDQRCWTWTKANTICLSLTNYLPPCLFSRSARSGLYSYEIQSPQHCSHKFRNAVPAIPSADRPPRQTLTTLTPTPLGQQTSPVQITGWPPRTTGVIGIHALGFALSIDQNWGAYSAATSGAPTAFLALASMEATRFTSAAGSASTRVAQCGSSPARGCKGDVRGVRGCKGCYTPQCGSSPVRGCKGR